MSPIGGGKPLFDLISSGRRPENQGAPPPDRRSSEGGQSVTLPTVWLYAGVGLVLLLLVGGYGLGYQLGTSSSREAERRAAERDAERVFVEDPLQQPRGETNTGGTSDGTSGDGTSNRPSGSSQRGPGDTQSRRAANERSPSQQNQSPIRAGTVMLSTGQVVPDPRQAGSNYLELVTLNRPQAIEAVRYLASNGEEAIAVPLDRRGSGSNTSDSFRIVAMGLAVPGERYSSSADSRRRFEERLARLGRTWADAGGASDFSDPLWRKFGD